MIGCSKTRVRGLGKNDSIYVEGYTRRQKRTGEELRQGKINEKLLLKRYRKFLLKFPLETSFSERTTEITSRKSKEASA